MSVADTHKNYSYDWWTPLEWLGWVSATIGAYHDVCPRVWREEFGDARNSDPIHCEYYNIPGSRNVVPSWWARAQKCLAIGQPLIWCAFNIEQLRHMDPSPFHLPGWLVMPRERIKFIWGGPTEGKRVHGQPCKSPSNWAVFWSTEKPAPTPSESIIVRTGV